MCFDLSSLTELLISHSILLAAWLQQPFWWSDSNLTIIVQLLSLLQWCPIDLAVELMLNRAVEPGSKPMLCALKWLLTGFESLLDVSIYVLLLD